MIEREVKLAAWPGFSLPDLDGVGDGARTRRRETVDLEATYFDTPDLRLGRRGITLRHRRRGAREIWTVKLPVGDASLAGGLDRDEIDVSAPEGEVPARLALIVAAHIRTAPLRPVARLSTVRRRTVVEGPDGIPLAEIDDDEVSVMDGGRVAGRFREIEVEIAPDASDDVARAVVERLCRAGAEESDPIPKVARALGPRFFDPPEAVTRDLPPEPSAAEVITDAIAAAVGRILDHHVVAIVGTDPEGVHQMRVGTRRLRSDLRTFRPLLDRAVSDPLRDEMRWLAEILGAVRDPDVMAGRLRAGAERVLDDVDEPAIVAVLSCLDADRDRAVTTLHDTLGSDRYLHLLDDLVALAESPPLLDEAGAPAAEALPGLVAKPWKYLRHLVRDIEGEPSDEVLHDVRKRAKQVRYAAEAVEPAVGSPARQAAKGAKGLQDTLGDHQDTVVAEEWLRGLLGSVDSGATFVLGALSAEQRVERAERRAEWIEQWEKASAADRWRWLR